MPANPTANGCDGCLRLLGDFVQQQAAPERFTTAQRLGHANAANQHAYDAHRGTCSTCVSLLVGIVERSRGVGPRLRDRRRSYARRVRHHLRYHRTGTRR